MIGSDESGPDSPQSDRSLLQSSSSSALLSFVPGTLGQPTGEEFWVPVERFLLMDGTETENYIF